MSDPHEGAAPLPDLPPVETPTAGFIVQLFVIPAVVVAVVIAVWLLFGRLAGGDRPAMDYVQAIEDASASSNRRFRAAYELANLIRNTDSLSSDPQLLGRLNALLARELASGTDESVQQFLALCLGEFKTLESEGGSPLKALSQALQSGRPIPIRIAAAMSLAKHAARLDGTLENPEAVAALVDAGGDSDAELRQVSTFALGFFTGTPAAAELRKRLTDEDRPTRYNAAVALGRRGDTAATGVLREMLTPAEVRQTMTATNPEEIQGRVEAIGLEAIRAVLASARRGDQSLADSLQPQIALLTTSEHNLTRLDAIEILKILQPRI